MNYTATFRHWRSKSALQATMRTLSRKLFAIGVAVTILHVSGARLGAATYGQEVVAAVLMGEARGEGREGMLAVAEVIRTRADQMGISPLAVVKQRLQFSCMNGLTPPQLIRKHWGNEQWETAIEIAQLLYNEPEKLPGITQGATHFDHGVPSWALGRTPVAVVGRHKFYRMD